MSPNFSPLVMDHLAVSAKLVLIGTIDVSKIYKWITIFGRTNICMTGQY